MSGLGRGRLRTAIDSVRAVVNHPRDPELLRWTARHAPRLERFRDRHRGERCFVIGNGPSLNQMDLRPLQRHHAFGLNKLYLGFERFGFTPSYMVAVNPLVIEQSRAYYRDPVCPTFLSFRPGRAVVAPHPSIYYVFIKAGPEFCVDLRLPVCGGYTVTFTALEIAHFMGFEEIYLIGVDHSFAVEGAPNSRQTLRDDDANHFHPDYFKGQAWDLPDLESSELAYRVARHRFRQDGRRIYDATVGGQLDVFDKIPYEEALARCSPRRC